MGFLAPLLLTLAGAAAVPLAIHLWRRRIGTRVEFPAARYLARAEQEHSRKLRLRNLALMLLRVAAVLLVALAAARPVARVTGGGHAPTAVALVLDNSMSSGIVVAGRPLLATLRESAEAVLERLGPADRVWLVTADGRTWGGSPDAVRQALEAVEPLAGGGDLREALVTAARLSRGAGLTASHVAVLTDGQATTWRETVSLGDVRVAVHVPVHEIPPNRAVLRAAAVPPRWTPRGAVEASILTADSVAYRLTLEGRTLARGIASGAGDDRTAAVLVRVAPPERGWVAGTVELEPDELRADDVAHFAVWIGPAPRVRADPSAGPFAVSAVDALAESERVAVGDGVAVVSAERLARRPALIFAPADPVHLGAANRALERAGVPWRFGVERRGAVALRGAGLDGTGVRRRHELLPRGVAAAETLAVVGTAPWAVAGAGYVLVASPLDPAWTDLPVRAALIPWITGVLTQRLTSEPWVLHRAAPGATLPRPAWADALERPDGDRVPLAGAELRAPERPGVSFLLRGGVRSGALVVNPDSAESHLARAAPGEIAARLTAQDVRVHEEADVWRESLFELRERRPLAAPLLLAALLVLFAEVLLAGAPRRPLPAGATG